MRNAKKQTYKDALNKAWEISGRVILNIWRYVKYEYNLSNYDLENVIYHIKGIRQAVFDNWTLTEWFGQGMKSRTRVFEYFLKRLNYCEEILEQIGTIGQGVEFTRLFGCEFESILFRGSQFRIEAIISRVCHQRDFLMLSASKYQVATQKLLQCVPLVLEPPKLFFVDPVIVLDFQSLYPSIMVAYNYCFSTCLGSIEETVGPQGEIRFGVRNDAQIQFKEIFGNRSFEDALKDIFISPCNVAFVRKNIREGIFPQVIHEFLKTRIMLKQSQQIYKNKKQFSQIQKLLNFRQAGLKLFMNICYGYAGATFSGRMPAVDISDSVVQTGKEILKQVIEQINFDKNWGAKVVYGDVDSVFVHLKGKTVQQAFEIGNEIEKTITKKYPYPMTLKFDKVYGSLILVSKKRYVGYKYDSPYGSPSIEAKGIEMVRKDGCEAAVKIMENVLHELFTTKNLSNVKKYLNIQWAKILKNHVNPKDFYIAKEVKLGKYKDQLPVHAIVACKQEEKDAVSRPKFGEKIKYLVVQGNQKSKIKDLAVSVDEFIQNNLAINSMFYIKNQINNALGRIFSSFDVKIDDWFNQMPKNLVKGNPLTKFQEIGGSTNENRSYNLQHYFRVNVCVLCYEQSKEEICKECSEDFQTMFYLIQSKMNILETDISNYQQICKNCSDLNFQGIEEVPCVEYNCDILYQRKLAKDMLHILKPVLIKYLNIISDK